MRADKYDPRYIYRFSPRHVYDDFFEWLRLHPIWVLAVPVGYLVYLVTTEEI